MVTETKERVEARPITLEELGKQIGVPIKVRPWWGSVRRYFGEQRLSVKLGEEVKVTEVGSTKHHLAWVCPGDGLSRKKRPEVQNGVIILWQGQCRYKPPYYSHSHAQIIKVNSVARQAMLITIRVSESGPARFLLGVDGRHPYVIQVGLRVQTVKEAFDWLIPKMVKEAIARGLDVKRQGDWFFIPTDKKPRIAGAPFDGNDYSVRPYRTNTLYKGIRLVYSGALTRHKGSQVYYHSVLGLPCPAPLVKGKITAPDHPTVILNDWHLGVRNRSHPWRNTNHSRHDD